MGRSRYKIYQPQDVHFLTNTILNWSPLFTRPTTVNLILDSWRYLQNNHQLKLYGYVLLENHIHWLAQSEDLPRDIARFKSFTGRRMIRYLQEKKQYKLLAQFAQHKKKHKKDRQYQVWEEGSHPELIQGEAMMRQKLEYIHQNPVKRGYVENAEHWRYSSAKNYEGETGLIDVCTRW